jgi:hypothetical protein
MTYEKTIDIDCFNDEQRPTELCYDCLEFWQYLYDTWKIDTSDEEYERWRDEQAENAYREKLELEFN